MSFRRSEPVVGGLLLAVLPTVLSATVRAEAPAARQALPAVLAASPLQGIILQAPDSAEGRAAARLRKRVLYRLTRAAELCGKHRRDHFWQKVNVRLSIRAGQAARVIGVSVLDIPENRAVSSFHRCFKKQLPAVAGEVPEVDTSVLPAGDSTEGFLMRWRRVARCPNQ